MILTRYRSRSGNFPCLACGKILSRHDALLRHERTAHGTGVHFWCREDGCVESKKGFRRFHDYRKHMRRVHSKVIAANDVSSQQSLRGNRHNIGRDESQVALPQPLPRHSAQSSDQPTPETVSRSVSHAVLEALPQVSRQDTQEAAFQDIPPARRQTVHAWPRPTPVYVPDFSSEIMFRKSDLLPQPNTFPTYVPDYVREGRRPEIMFRKTDAIELIASRYATTPLQLLANYHQRLPARLNREVNGSQSLTSNNNCHTGYGEQERRGFIQMVDTQTFMYNELQHKYNRAREESERLAISLSVLEEKVRGQTGGLENSGLPDGALTSTTSNNKK